MYFASNQYFYIDAWQLEILNDASFSFGALGLFPLVVFTVFIGFTSPFHVLVSTPLYRMLCVL